MTFKQKLIDKLNSVDAITNLVFTPKDENGDQEFTCFVKDCKIQGVIYGGFEAHGKYYCDEFYVQTIKDTDINLYMGIYSHFYSLIMNMPSKEGVTKHEQDCKDCLINLGE